MIFKFSLQVQVSQVCQLGPAVSKIEDDIEEDREDRSKDEMDEKFLLKTVPNCKNIFGSELDQGSYTN